MIYQVTYHVTYSVELAVISPTLPPNLLTLQSQLFAGLNDLGFGEWLAEQVSCHLVCGNVLHSQNSLLYFISEPVVSQVQVLHSPMMFRILGY